MSSTRWTFKLRDNAKWSNGDPVTAGDFVFSLRRLVNPETASFFAETLDAIKNVSAIVAGEQPVDALGVSANGDQELVITLERKTPYFLSLLTHPSAFPVNARNIAEYGEAFSRPGNLVSNGAYKLDDWVLGAVIEISRNEFYWNDEQTAIDTVRHHVVQEPTAELLRYRAGELDITSTVPTDAFESIRETRPSELRTAPILSVYFFGMNLSRPKLGDNPALREALSMAVDRQALVEQVIARGEEPAYSFVPPGIDNYEAPELPFAMMSTEARQERARKLYRDAGYGPDAPLEIELRYNTSETHRRIALAVQEMWKQVLGFEATLINEEFRVLVANMRAMQITELFRLSWNGEFNDPSAFLSLFESENPSNMFGYANPNFDRLMKDAIDQVDPDRRRSFYEEAERELLSDHVVIPLYFRVSKHLVSPDIRGWEDNVLDYHYSQHLSFDTADR